MKEKEIKSFFDSFFQAPEKFGDLSELLERSLGFFQEVTEYLKQASPEEREKINVVLKEVEQNLNNEFDNLCKRYGVQRSDLEQMISNPQNFKSEDWDQLQTFQKEVAKTSINPEKKSLNKTKKAKTFNKKKSWVSA